MLILVEGYLKKRCANLPVMRRRYCMLVVDDSNPSSSRIKVMIRSYKREEDRAASIDSFVSSHVVKCIGEWTGKGNLHTYPHAFVVETLQSKLFHCSAETAEAKAAWVNAISVYDRFSMGSSIPPADVSTPINDDRESVDTADPPVDPESPPPVRVASVRAPSSDRAILRHEEQPMEVARPPSKRGDMLFKSKSKHRANFNDLEIESDEGSDGRVESIHLDQTLLKKGSSRTIRLDDDDDIPFVHMQAAPSMRMQYTTTTATATAPPARADLSATDDDEEYIELDPDMVARFSHIRMMEARGQMATQSTAPPVSRSSRHRDAGRPKKKKDKAAAAAVVEVAPVEVPKKKKKKDKPVTDAPASDKKKKKKKPIDNIVLAAVTTYNPSGSYQPPPVVPYPQPYAQEPYPQPYAQPLYPQPAYYQPPSMPPPLSRPLKLPDIDDF
ncbi:Aste57867_18766 [Aphanomyces stellatus]|uniref:Aste57867_18766 protein n=1 Tax=Aphanomyces stellatus TaxID=120398 RepID=A0A485LCN0_9STRA|nr:hypothetical protein As57867_018702 [Aphanomyces stellatus]VFT95500.1 Aste57867_18766 [Aphanomyces stellatus]